MLGITVVLEADQSSVRGLVSRLGCIQVRFWLLEAGRVGVTSPPVCRGTW